MCTVGNQTLVEILQQYRNGERGLPTYEELQVIATPAATSGDAPADKDYWFAAADGVQFQHRKYGPGLFFPVNVARIERAAAPAPSGQAVAEMLVRAMGAAGVPGDARGPLMGFFANEWNKWLAAAPATASGDELPDPVKILSGALNHAREALRFYAEQEHFIIADKDAWDTVSSEPQNFMCDEAGTATVEDGSFAKRVLEDIAGTEAYASVAASDRAAVSAATKPTADIAHWEGLTDLFGIIAAKHGINDIQVNGGTADELFPRVLAEFIVAASRGAEPDYTFEHLAGRGLHELRADELPAYLASVAHNFGARSTEFTTAAQWVAAEIERKTNDERILAVKLADVQSLLATKPAAAPAVPEGFVLAPIKSTSKMERAGMKALCNLLGETATQVDAEGCWSAMIEECAATPTASTTGAAQTAEQVRDQALEEAAKLAIKFTAVPRDLLGPATPQMKAMAAIGEKLATAIRALATPAPASAGQAAPAVVEPAGWRAFIENIATPYSEPLNSISGYKDKASRQEFMGILRTTARELLSAQPAEGAGQASCGWKDCPHGSECVHAAAPVPASTGREEREARHARIAERFANRKRTPATADFDLPAPNDPVAAREMDVEAERPRILQQTKENP